MTYEQNNMNSNCHRGKHKEETIQILSTVEWINTYSIFINEPLHDNENGQITYSCSSTDETQNIM